MKSSDSQTNVVVVNNNDTSAQHKEDLLEALRLSQSDSDKDSPLKLSQQDINNS